MYLYVTAFATRGNSGNVPVWEITHAVPPFPSTHHQLFVARSEVTKVPRDVCVLLIVAFIASSRNKNHIDRVNMKIAVVTNNTQNAPAFVSLMANAKTSLSILTMSSRVRLENC
jgi:hypothetical protein